MATTTSAANAIATVVSSDVVRGIFTNDEFFSLFSQQVSGGDTSYRWNLMTSGVAGAAAAEGDAFAAVDANAYSRPVLAYRLYQATISVTDHLKAALKNSQSAYFDAIARETQEAIAGVKDAVMTQWLGATAEGIRLGIDSTGTYAGLDHAAITGWDAVEDTTSAALSYAMLDDLRETLMDNEHASSPNLMLGPHNQISNYTRLAGPGVRNSFSIMIPNGAQPNSDIGEAREGVKFGGMPFIGLRDLDNSTILMLPREKVLILHHERNAGDGGWVTEEVPRGGFVSQVNISYFGLIVVTDPFKCGKLSGVTA